ncbi:hypothetical protein C1H46_043035 [Malus baccata]|uniref:Purple acid phosphatase N-terminal domain-containing protein n=1 Tax=Malus baccata TaxID=106549 RepID=A0A540KB24_MALBA|nr:hypothetical protein C1H46_043035 [Malus baccata]
MAFSSCSSVPAVAAITCLIAVVVGCYSPVEARIPTTLDGPFEPLTVPFDPSLRGNAVDLPDDDQRVRRRVKGFEPEQISVSLSADYDSVWISWITGFENWDFSFFGFG